MIGKGGRKDDSLSSFLPPFSYHFIQSSSYNKYFLIIVHIRIIVIIKYKVIPKQLGKKEVRLWDVWKAYNFFNLNRYLP